MSNISENLKLLLYSHDLSPTALSKRLDIAQQTLQKIIAGISKRPHPSTVQCIAEYFNISETELLGQLPITYIEKIYKGPIVNHTTIQVPLLSFENICKWLNKQYIPSDFIPFSKHISFDHTNLFSTIMPDDVLSPYIQKGSILLFKPENKFIDRKFMLLRLSPEKSPLLRQIIFSEKDIFAKTLNPRNTINNLLNITDQDECIAQLIEARLTFNDEA